MTPTLGVNFSSVDSTVKSKIVCGIIGLRFCGKNCTRWVKVSGAVFTFSSLIFYDICT